MKNYKTEIKKDLAKNTDLYKMNEITQKLKLTARAIRYYESEGLLGDIKRSIGYTRYFTGDDIERLKEVKRLKKKGQKIAQIKEAFSEKYKNNPIEIHHECSIDSTLIEEKDIAKCMSLGIEINDVQLMVNNVTLNYLDWYSIESEEYLREFKILKPSKSKRTALTLKSSTQWLGNGQRCIIIDALKNQAAAPLSPKYIEHQLNYITEWLILPIQFATPYLFKDELSHFYLLEKRAQNHIDRKIVPIDELFLVLEKQVKHIASTVNGVLKQVAFHTNKTMKDAKRMKQFIQKLVPNKERLTIEDLSPIYIQSIGSNQAFLLSTLS